MKELPKGSSRINVNGSATRDKEVKRSINEANLPLVSSEEESPTANGFAVSRLARISSNIPSSVVYLPPNVPAVNSRSSSGIMTEAVSD
jgi:hypothetical protein